MLNLTYYALLGMFLSCVTQHPDHSKIELKTNKELRQDSDYLDAYTKETRSLDYIHNFETHYQMTVTRLSPSFRKAFSERFTELYKEQKPFLEESSQKTGFFVSFFTPEEDLYKLNDPLLWNIKLKIDDQTLAPSLVKKLRRKHRWTPFFPAVHQWSHEYLILFDITTPDDQLLYQKPMELMFSHASAQLIMRW